MVQNKYFPTSKASYSLEGIEWESSETIGNENYPAKAQSNRAPHSYISHGFLNNITEYMFPFLYALFSFFLPEKLP